MFEYGALFNDSFVKELGENWDSMVHFLSNLPFYWYIVIVVVLIVLAKILIKS